MFPPYIVVSLDIPPRMIITTHTQHIPHTYPTRTPHVPHTYPTRTTHILLCRPQYLDGQPMLAMARLGVTGPDLWCAEMWQRKLIPALHAAHRRGDTTLESNDAV